MMRGWVALGLAVGALSCSTSVDSASPEAAQVRLPQGVAAKVGAEEIALDTVTRIARTQQVSLPTARDLALRDAAFAAGARAFFAGSTITPVVQRAAFARALLETFKTEAAALGPPSDAEVGELTALRWQEFDRPETVRTTHAVAIVSKPNEDAQARAVAQRVYDVVRGVTDPDEFIRLAKDVPHVGVELRAERLPPMTRDGRSYFPEGARPGQSEQRFDKDFAQAGYRLAAGQVGEPAKSVFGYHVILCEARLPEKRVPLQERRTLLTSEVLKGRAERSKQELLERLSRSLPIAVTRSVDDLTTRVRVAE